VSITMTDERREKKKPKSDFHNPGFGSLRWQQLSPIKPHFSGGLCERSIQMVWRW